MADRSAPPTASDVAVLRKRIVELESFIITSLTYSAIGCFLISVIVPLWYVTEPDPDPETFSAPESFRLLTLPFVVSHEGSGMLQNRGSFVAVCIGVMIAALVFALAGTMSMGNSIRQRVEAWHTVAVAMGFAAIAALWILMWIIGSGDEDDEFVDLTGPGMLTLTLACTLCATVRVAVINFGADSQRKR